MQDTDIRRAVTAVSAMPAATLRDSAFLAALGTPALLAIPPQTGSLAQRAIEEWERKPLWEQSSGNPRADADRQTRPHQEDGGEMLIAIVLDRPLAEAQALVNTPDGEYSRCLHPSTHHNHARQEEPPGHCPHDPAGHKRWCSTRGGYSELLQSYSQRAAKSPPTHSHI